MTAVCENGMGMTTVNTRVLVSDYIKHHLQKHNLPWHSQHDDDLPPPGSIQMTMRALGDEFEERYREVFEEMSHQLHITPNTAQQTFLGVVNELFSDGINWGRIVALFSFGATLAVQCVENEMPAVVDQLVDWISQYVDSNLYSWIQEHNGWDGFIEFYEGGPERRLESPWPSIGMICTYAAGAIGVLTLGAILSQKT